MNFEADYAGEWTTRNGTKAIVHKAMKIGSGQIWVGVVLVGGLQVPTYWIDANSGLGEFDLITRKREAPL